MVNPLLGWPVILRIIASWNFVTFKISVSSFITWEMVWTGVPDSGCPLFLPSA